MKPRRSAPHARCPGRLLPAVRRPVPGYRRPGPSRPSCPPGGDSRQPPALPPLQGLLTDGAISSAIVVSSALPSADAQRLAHSGSWPASHSGGRSLISSARSAPTASVQGSASWALLYPSVASMTPSRGVVDVSTTAARNSSSAPAPHKLVVWWPSSDGSRGTGSNGRPSG